jgi:N-acyl-L-homoserine lactone synthetase
MIVVVEPYARAMRKTQLTEMFRLRARIFRDELGWEVEVHDGKEFDKYDLEENVYLLSLNEQGAVDGSLRLMPTTGPTQLTDIFGELVPSDTALRSPHIWEATRFCTCRKHSPLLRGIARSAWHLVIGAIELARQAGIDSFVMIYDARVRRLYRMMGFQVDDISLRRDHTGTIFFGLAHVAADAALQVRDKAGIDYDVFSAHLGSLAA